MPSPSCLLYHYQQGISESETKIQAAKQVFIQVSIFYKKANIPMDDIRNKSLPKNVKTVETKI